MQRQGWPVETHLQALDSDLDTLEVLIQEIRAEVHSMKAVMIGLMVSITSAAVVGALNLFYGKL